MDKDHTFNNHISWYKQNRLRKFQVTLSQSFKNFHNKTPLIDDKYAIM